MLVKDELKDERKAKLAAARGGSGNMIEEGSDLNLGAKSKPKTTKGTRVLVRLLRANPGAHPSLLRLARPIP
jgi:hypothetical protein